MQRAVGPAEHARLAEQPSGETAAHEPRAARRLLEPHAEQAALHDEHVARRVPLAHERFAGGERPGRRGLGEARGEIVGEGGEAAGVAQRCQGLEAHAALFEERVDRRAVERVAVAEVERERGGLLERGEIEPVGELARGGFEVAAREAQLAELLFDLRHREERRAAAIVVAEHAGEEVAGLAERAGVPLRDRRLDAHRDRLDLVEHLEAGVVVVVAEPFAEVTEVVGGRREGSALRAADGFDHVLGAEHGRRLAAVGDREIGDVEIARRRREHDGDEPSVARDLAHAADVANVEQPAELGAQRLRDVLPDFLPRHSAGA